MSRSARSGFHGAARAVSLIAASCFLTACSGALVGLSAAALVFFALALQAAAMLFLPECQA